MHPRKKRKICSDGQYGNREDEGPSSQIRSGVGPTNKVEDKELSIVISDSDSSDLEEDISVRQRRASHRKTLAAKRKIARMTEEEQLALAVKISQQEQSTRTKHTQEDDDELLRKAIEESLQSCNVQARSHGLPVELFCCEDVVLEKQCQEKGSIVLPHVSSGDPLQGDQVLLPRSSQNTAESTGYTLDIQSVDRLSQQSWMSDQGHPQSPKVLLKRLSQDVVESTSVILSPNCKDPFSCVVDDKSSSSFSQNDFVGLLLPKASLSPVFPVKSSYAHRLIPCSLFEDKGPRVERPENEAGDIGSHCFESPQLDSASLLAASNSEVIEDKSSYQNPFLSKQKQETCFALKYNKHDISKAEDSADKNAKKQQNKGSVHYYWGVPFCPKGTDPNTYTQVILCQLETYEKSLKKAQRQLLNKTEYNQPIHLVASSEITEHKDNLDSLSQEDTEEIVEVSDPQTCNQSQPDENDEIQPFSSKKPRFYDRPLQQSQEDDHSCPIEDEPVKQPTQPPFTDILLDECEEVAGTVLGESSIPPTDEKDENCPKKHIEIDQEEEVTSCPETQLSPVIQKDGGQNDEPDLTNTPELSQTPSSIGLSYEKNVSFEPRCPQNVECPMCGCKFMQDQIERHAAYCDGTKEEPEMAVLRPRNRVSRQTNDEPLNSTLPSDSGKCEKCYLCKSLVPLKDYHVHVDSCLKIASSGNPETLGPGNLKNIQETPARGGRLLSMLEHTEAMSADESNTIDVSYMSPPREHHPNSLSIDHLSVSDSPIRSFLSISEATDCLVDFKRQFSRPTDRQSNRRRPKNRSRMKRKRM